MEQQTPLFLMRARDLAVFILIIVGLGLLFVYGSRAIATADDRRYVEGWKNRPFLAEPVVSEKSLQSQSAAKIEKVTKLQEPTKQTTDDVKSEAANAKITTLPEKTQPRHQPQSKPKPSVNSRPNKKAKPSDNKQQKPLRWRLDLSLGRALNGLGL